MLLNIGVVLKLKFGANKMNTSTEGIELIKHYEGCELKAYRCPADVLTIGYGVTKGVTEDMEITQQQADEMLEAELVEYEHYLDNMVKVTLNQNQYDSLIAWIYNLGPTNLKKSTLLIVLNNGNYENVPDQIKRWNKANGKVLNGLVKRRNSEALLFEGKDWRSV